LTNILETLPLIDLYLPLKAPAAQGGNLCFEPARWVWSSRAPW
jgi:hypothetical protein